MIRLLVHFAALRFCLSEPSKNSVDQSPAALIKHPGEEVRIDCNHSNTAFDLIQWYKQSSGESDMLLVGYARFTSPVVEAPFKDSYNVSGIGSSRAFLHIPKPGVSEDGAVYFCAASRAQCCTAPSL
ncbi:uncharacterized protein ACO6RY_07260 [Pungitius sinensis]